MPKLPPPRSHLRFPLDSVLGNLGKVRVLRALFRWPGPMSVTQLASETRLTPQGVRVVLDALVAHGVVSIAGAGRTQLYGINEAHPACGALRQLFDSERNQWEAALAELRELLRQSPEVVAAWLYGSVARGEDRSDSDVDVAVVLATGSDGAVVMERLGSVEQKLGVTFSPVAVDEKELEAGTVDERWWDSVVRDGIQLKGTLVASQALGRGKSP